MVRKLKNSVPFTLFMALSVPAFALPDPQDDPCTRGLVSTESRQEGQARKSLPSVGKSLRSLFLRSSTSSLSPSESGLVAIVAAIAGERNHPSQFPDFLRHANAVLAELESIEPKDENFYCSYDDFKLFQTLRKTSFTKRSREQLITAVNHTMPHPIDAEFKGKGLHIDSKFVEGLENLKVRAEGLGKKLDLLEAKHLKFYWYAKESIAFNRFDSDGSKAFEAMVNIAQNKVKRPYSSETRDPSQEEVEAAAHYLALYAAGRAPDLSLVYDALATLEDRKKARPGDLAFAEAVPRVAERTLLEISQGGFRAHLAKKMVSTLFLKMFIHKIAVNEILELVVSALQRGKAREMIDSMESFFYFGEDQPRAYRILEEAFSVIKLKANPDRVAEYSEIMYLLFIARCVESAREFDKWLSRGMGYHNAVRIRSIMQDAVLGTTAYEALGQRSSLTANLDLAELKEIFEGLQYDNQGRRAMGDNITAQQAFGLNGATRQEATDIYSLIGLYINKSSVDANKIEQGLTNLMITAKPR